MSSNEAEYDAVVIGAGPNGLAAAVTLAEADRSVLVLEANDTVGGGARSAELTRPGFVHDLGSSIHPLGVASPFFRTLPLEEYGLKWIWPEFPLAHPLSGGRAVVLDRSLAATAAGLGRDGKNYRRLMAPLVRDWDDLLDEVLQPVLHVPRYPISLARFGMRALPPAEMLARAVFRDPEARALFAGIAAHANLPLSAPGSSAFGLVLGLLGHAVGWPLPEGGAQAISDALTTYLEDLGGVVRTGRHVHNLRDVPPARTVLFDTAPRQLAEIAGGRLPESYRRRLLRYRHGAAAFKVDYALSDPIPWAAPACRRAGTVHVGGRMEEIAASEQAVADGRAPKRPFVLLAQHSLFDPARVPESMHTAWAYCHVPHAWDGDAEMVAGRLEVQIERFAPGFRSCVVERFVSPPARLQAQNPTLIGGDINGGAMDLWQIIARPVLSAAPYRTPADGIYLCSASTPPGGGVHGMCGHRAARTALQDMASSS